MEAGDHQNDFPWHLGVFDAHCHPTDTLASLDSIPSMRAKTLTIMATRAQDQELVSNAANKYRVSEAGLSNGEVQWGKHRIIPAFGWHPWFSHQMFDEAEYGHALSLTGDQKVAHYQRVLKPRSKDSQFLQSLPTPRPFKHFIDQTRGYLERHPLALIGEVGLDRSFRIPEAWLPEQVDERDEALTPGGREGRKLSPYTVSLDHQKKTFSVQLRLAGEMKRAVSVHGVQAHGAVYDVLAECWKGHEKHVPSKRGQKQQASIAKANAEVPNVEAETITPSGPNPYPPRICLHSFSGPAETVRQYIAPSVPCEIFFSFSTTINHWSSTSDGKVEAAVRAVPDDRILAESDLHTAGESMDFYLEQVTRRICHVKNWTLEEGVKMLGRNWRRYVFGKST